MNAKDTVLERLVDQWIDPDLKAIVGSGSRGMLQDWSTTIEPTQAESPKQDIEKVWKISAWLGVNNIGLVALVMNLTIIVGVVMVMVRAFLAAVDR